MHTSGTCESMVKRMCEEAGVLETKNAYQWNVRVYGEEDVLKKHVRAWSYTN